jgi:serine protease Do
MRRKNILGTMGLVFIGIVFGAVLVSGFGLVRPSYGEVKIGADKAPVQVNSTIAAFNDAFVQVADKVTPSIVQITVTTQVKNNQQQGFHFFFSPFNNNDDTPQQQQGGGSGIIISDDGYILTNNHVVQDAKNVVVTLHDKREMEATVIGTDPLTDLAVIKIDTKDLPAAYLGDSDKLKVGQWVMAIGNPLNLNSTVTAGIISAKNRQIDMPEENSSYSVRDFIQTDAVINPGNSGGALVDLNGAVIGVNAAIATSGFSQTFIGYGFAVPINLAKAVASDLIANGKVNRGYIGVSIEAVDAALAKAVGLKEPKGVIVRQIVKDGAASKEDIKVDDIILKIDEREVNQPNELQSYVASRRAGTSVKLSIYRDEKMIERYVTLKARSGEEEKTTKVGLKDKKGKDVDAREVNFDDLGMKVRNMNGDEKEKYNVDQGVIITEVKQFSKAYNQRLQEGLVIIAADRKDVSTAGELQSILEKKKGQAVLLRVRDAEGNSRLIGIDIPK